MKSGTNTQKKTDIGASSHGNFSQHSDRRSWWPVAFYGFVDCASQRVIIHTHSRTHTYILTHTLTHTYTHIHTHSYTHTLSNTHTHTQKHTHSLLHTHMYTRARARARARAHTHIAHTHTHTHTHKSHAQGNVSSYISTWHLMCLVIALLIG